MIHKAVKIFAVLAVLATGAYGLHTQSACASSTIAEQTCDTKVWQTMTTRALMETEREIMQNQNLIFKPDSVLAYVCFDKFAGHAAKNVGELFSETSFFNGAKINKGSETTTAVSTIVVSGSMSPYITGNFNHGLLGGRGGDLGIAGSAYSPSASTSYACSTMSEVWKAAKCMNFMHASNWTATDGFYPFKTLKPLGGGAALQSYQSRPEVRQFPTPCSGGPFPAAGGGGTWESVYEESRNETGGNFNRLYEYGTPNQKVFEDVRKKVEPGTCTGTAIKTGLKVILGPSSSATPKDDGVCTNPGCRLGSSGNCE